MYKNLPQYFLVMYPLAYNVNIDIYMSYVVYMILFSPNILNIYSIYLWFVNFIISVSNLLLNDFIQKNK